jgi:hypothetical protein
MLNTTPRARSMGKSSSGEEMAAVAASLARPFPEPLYHRQTVCVRMGGQLGVKVTQKRSKTATIGHW